MWKMLRSFFRDSRRVQWCPAARRSAGRRGFSPAFQLLEARRLLAAADLFEPDDTAEIAKPILPNGPGQTHSIHVSDDVDWTRFALTSTSDVAAEVTVPQDSWIDVGLFREDDLTSLIAQADRSGLLRAFALDAGNYFLRATSYAEIDSYTLAVRTSAPVPTLERPNFIRLAGEGFNSLQLAPDGRLAQLLWYGEALMYRVRDASDLVVEETVHPNPFDVVSYGDFSPQDNSKAQLLYQSDGTPHIVLLGFESLRHFVRDEAGWSEQPSIPVPLQESEYLVHLAADVGLDDSLHVAVTAGSFFDDVGRLLYGSNKNGAWAMESVAEPAATVDYSYFSGLNPRYVSLAVDSQNYAHIAYTPEFRDNGTGGYARPFDQLAYATNRTGVWRTEVVHQPGDDSGESGVASSIALGPGDRPAIANFFVERVSTGSAQFSQLLYHERRDNGTWTSETVANSPDGYVAGDGPRFTGFAPHLVFDALGQPHIAFADHASQHFPGFGADEFAGQIRHAVKQNSRWSLETVFRQTDPLRNMIVYPTLAILPQEIAFTGLRRVARLAADLTVVRSDYYYAFVSQPRTGLTVAIAQPSIFENGQTTLTVTRHNGNNAVPLAVSLANTDPSEATFPASVTIPAGGSQVTVALLAVNDGLVDGAQTVRITAAASGYYSGSSILQVRDVPFAKLRGQKFEDRDGDGVHDVGEPGLAGWTIFLDADGDGELGGPERSTVTDSAGNYAFMDLPAGSYRVAEVVQADWLQTAPATAVYEVAVVGGDDVGDLDFGGLPAGFQTPAGLLALLLSGDSDAGLSSSGGRVQVTRDGGTDAAYSGVLTSEVYAVLVQGGPGDNTIDLSGVTRAAYGGLASITVHDGPGRDRLLGSELADLLDAAWGQLAEGLDSGSDELDGGAGDDVLVGQGPDVLRGAEGDDVLVVRDLLFQEADGGSGFDVLRWGAHAGSLDLSAVAAGRIAGIEAVDLVGSGGHRLTLTYASIVGLSDATDALTIYADSDDTLALDGGWRLAETQVTDGLFFRVLRQADATVLLNGPHDWQNPLQAQDVDANGRVEPLDVLLVINQLNSPTVLDATRRFLEAASVDPFPMRFYDVDGDGVGAPLDVLTVINFINQQVTSGGEGEQSPAQSTGYGVGSVDFLAGSLNPADGRPIPAPAISGSGVERSLAASAGNSAQNIQKPAMTLNVGQNKSAQFRHSELHEKRENPCRNCADLFWATDLAVGTWWPENVSMNVQNAVDMP